MYDLPIASLVCRRTEGLLLTKVRSSTLVTHLVAISVGTEVLSALQLLHW